MNHQTPRMLTFGLLALAACDGGAEFADAGRPRADAADISDAAVACLPEAATLAGPLGTLLPVVALAGAPGGVVVFWANRLESVHEELSGIFAGRPGEIAVRLLPARDVAQLAIAEVEDGYLLCFTEGHGSPDSFSGCFTVDASLSPRGASFAAQVVETGLGWVPALARLGGALHAVAMSASGGLRLVPVDTFGMPLSEGTALDCDGSAFATYDAGLVCLRKSSPRCGSQFDEPVGCTYTVVVYDPRGRQVASWPELIPFGEYGALAQVRLAAREDDLLIAWSLEWGTTRVLPVRAGGSPGPGVDLPISLWGVAATPDGYLVLGAAPLPEDTLSSFPVVAAFDGGGRLQGVPRWLITPSANERERQRTAAPSLAVRAQPAETTIAWVGASMDAERQPENFLHLRTLTGLAALPPAFEVPAPRSCPVFAPVPAAPTLPPSAPATCHPNGESCPPDCPTARAAPVDLTLGCVDFSRTRAVGCFVETPPADTRACLAEVQTGEVLVVEGEGAVAGPGDVIFRPCTGRERASAARDCRASTREDCETAFGADCRTSGDCSRNMACFGSLATGTGTCLCAPGAFVCEGCCCASPGTSP